MAIAHRCGGMTIAAAAAGAYQPRMDDRPQPIAPLPLRLRLDGAALAANYRWLVQQAGAPAIPAIKADGYGLGARGVLHRLRQAGAREFAVASWPEALALQHPDASVIVFHGFTDDDAMAASALPRARPVLVTPAQCAAWQRHFPGRAADLMVDTGMNRLGLGAGELAAADGIAVHMLHSHLACADQPGHPLTARQLERFRALAGWRPEVPRALANSAGICCGPDYGFDAVRPGLGLYGGVPHPAARIRPVVTPEARVIQLRDVAAGQTVGYGALWQARRASRIAVLNIGYADGIARALRHHLAIVHDGRRLPLAGQISMDMIAVDASGADIREGDWLALDFDLPTLGRQSGVSQYELLVWMGARYDRIWA